jgi:hypothetical protein
MEQKQKVIEKLDLMKSLIVEKHSEYGNTFKDSSILLKTLYPEGVSTSQYTNFCLVVRILDKIKRVTNCKDSKVRYEAYQDIAGYAILGVSEAETL